MATTNWTNVNKNMANFATQMQNILANKQAKAKADSKAQRQIIGDKNSAFDRKKQNLNDLISGLENKISGLQKGNILSYEEDEINDIYSKLETYEGERMALLEGNYSFDDDLNIAVDYTPPEKSKSYVPFGTQLRSEEDFKRTLEVVKSVQSATVSQLRMISTDFNQNIRPKLTFLNKKEREYNEYSILKEKFNTVKSNLDKSTDDFMDAGKKFKNKKITAEEMSDIKSKTFNHYKDSDGAWQKIYLDDFSYNDYQDFKSVKPKPEMTKDDHLNKNVYLQGLVKIMKMKYPTFNINVDNVEKLDEELTRVWSDANLSVDFNAISSKLLKERSGVTK